MGNVLILSGGSIDYEWASYVIDKLDIKLCIAADSGLKIADKLGIKVNLILGDYDSVDAKLLECYKKNVEFKTYPRQKDYTDTHIALKYAINFVKEKKEGCIYIIGATGNRMDHTFTNVGILAEALNEKVKAYILDRHDKIYIKDSSFTINKEKQYGRYVSFVPMTEVVNISISGMKYGLDNYELHQGNSICQSNEIESENAFVTIHSGRVIVFESID